MSVADSKEILIKPHMKEPQPLDCGVFVMDKTIKLNRSHIAKALKGREDITITQLSYLGIKDKPINWIDDILNKTFTIDQIGGFTGTLPVDPRIRRFIKPKKKPKKKLKKNTIKKHQPADYKESKDWDEKRKRIYKRDNYRCVGCGNKGKLNAHHLLYDRDKEIWDVPDYYLVSLCDECHKKEHSKRLIPPTKHY